MCVVFFLTVGERWLVGWLVGWLAGWLVCVLPGVLTVEIVRLGPDEPRSYTYRPVPLQGKSKEVVSGRTMIPWRECNAS
jgi:hypothetical protein